jgi:hypothetical protein
MSLGIRIAIASVLLAGCASTVLRAAATRTLAVQSFHGQTTFQASAGDATGTVDYQA